MSFIIQEPFDNVPLKFQQKMNEEICHGFMKTLRRLNIKEFVSVLADIIVLELQQWEETPAIEDYELVAAASVTLRFLSIYVRSCLGWASL